MIKKYLFLIILLIPVAAYPWGVATIGSGTVSGSSAPNPNFVFTIHTVGASDTFTLPLVDSGTHNFTVDWGDENSDEITAYNDADITHTYATEDEYEITISGTMGGWAFSNGGDVTLMRDISNWGCFRILSAGCFYGASNLTVSATDAPTEMTTLYTTFENCSSLTSLAVSSWDVSGVTSLYRTFYGCSSLTSLDVSLWDVGSVTTLYRTFLGCSSLSSLDVSSWDVSNVTTLYRTFYNCSALTSLDVSSWDVSSVTSLDNTFYGCSALTSLNVSSWDVSGVTVGTGFLQLANSALSQSAYDALLIAWSAQSLQSSVTIHFGDATYTSGGAAETARGVLTGTYSWSITDGGAN